MLAIAAVGLCLCLVAIVADGLKVRFIICAALGLGQYMVNLSRYRLASRCEAWLAPYAVAQDAGA